MFSVKKSGKWEVVVKSGPFLNAGCIMDSISIFILHFANLGGCVRTQRNPPPLPTGLQSFADAPNRAGMDDKLLSLSGYFGLGPGLRLEAIIRNLLRSS